ncbi:secretin and TonB N-terminal domain-containing protein, partial [Bacteroidota bacterium]
MKTIFSQKDRPRVIIFKSWYFRIIVACLLFIFIYTNAFSQNSIKDKELSISVAEKTLTEILIELREISGFEFSYNSDIIPKNKIITLIAIDKNIEEILSRIFQGTRLRYKVVDNSIIIYQARVDKSAKPVTVNLNNEQIKIIEIYDTIVNYQNDTIINTVYDTVNVIKEDTIIIYDTVEYIIEREKPVISNISVDIYGSLFNKSLNYRSNTSDDADYAQLYNEAVRSKINYTFGSNVNFYLNNYVITTGIAYTVLKNQVNYNNDYYTYFNNTRYIDTSFYKIIGDTTGYLVDGIPVQQEANSTIVIDSVIEESFIDSTESNFKYNGTNKYLFIDIPLLFGYKIELNERLDLIFNGGLNTSILLKANGYSINDTSYSALNRSDISPVNFKLNLGAEVSYSLSSKINFFTN